MKIVENASICSLTITFFPDFELLTKQASSLSNQVKKMLIVDNSADEEVASKLCKVLEPYENATIIFCIKNYGLAHGINLGIDTLKNEDFTHLVIFDQDSVPQNELIYKLLKTFLDIESRNIKIAAIGPNHCDPRTNYKSVFKGEKVILDGESQLDLRTVSYLQTSGSVFSFKALEETGFMEDYLFIHHIDLEWCYRARMFDYGIYGLNGVYMNHIVGDKVLRFWIGFWRDIHLNSPFRNFYIFRNSIILFKRDYIPLRWKIRYSIQLVILFLITIIYGTRKITQFEKILMGVGEGFKEQAKQKF